MKPTEMKLPAKGHTSWWLTPDIITKDLISSSMLRNCVYMNSKLHSDLPRTLSHIYIRHEPKKLTVVAVVVTTGNDRY